MPSSPRRKSETNHPDGGWAWSGDGNIGQGLPVPSFLAVLATGFPSVSMHIDQLPHEWHFDVPLVVRHGGFGLCRECLLLLWHPKLHCAPRHSTWVCPPRQWDCQVDGQTGTRPWQVTSTSRLSSWERLSQEVTGYMATGNRQEWPYLCIFDHDCNRIELTKISKIQMDAHVICLYELSTYVLVHIYTYTYFIFSYTLYMF